MFICLVHNSSL